MTDLNATDESEHTRTERHASWTELFFDLVAVAAVSAIAHVLATGLDAAALGLYALLFLAFWLSWTTFMLYGNVAAGGAHVTRLILGMVGLGVMAVSVPGIAHTVVEHGTGDRASTVFTVAYVVTRLYGAHAWRRGEVLVDFPVAQYTGGVLPWLVSIWVDEPWKLLLWAVGVGIDLVLIFLVSGHSLVERFRTKAGTPAGTQLAARRRRRPPAPERRRGRRARDRATPAVREVLTDAGHLSERLGLFVIIVLGEAVVQVVDAASVERYDLELFTTGLAAFALLAGMFGLSVVFGYAGLPHLRSGRVPVRTALGLHCVVTGVVATIAVSLSGVITHGPHPLPGPDRWLLCGALAAYFALGVLTGVVSRSSDRQQTVSRVITGILLPLLLALLAPGISAHDLVIYLALIVLAHLWFERRSTPAG